MDDVLRATLSAEPPIEAHVGGAVVLGLEPNVCHRGRKAAGGGKLAHEVAAAVAAVNGEVLGTRPVRAAIRTRRYAYAAHHRLLDLIVVDSAGAAIGRPLVTMVVWIDIARSRPVVVASRMEVSYPTSAPIWGRNE